MECTIQDILSTHSVDPLFYWSSIRIKHWAKFSQFTHMKSSLSIQIISKAINNWVDKDDNFMIFTDYSQDLQTRSNSETSLVSSNLGSNQLDVFNDDTELLLPSGGNSPNRLKTPHLGVRRLSATNKTLGGSLFTLVQPSLEPGVFRSLNYPAFQSLRIERVWLPIRSRNNLELVTQPLPLFFSAKA